MREEEGRGGKRREDEGRGGKRRERKVVRVPEKVAAPEEHSSSPPPGSLVPLY